MKIFTFVIVLVASFILGCSSKEDYCCCILIEYSGISDAPHDVFLIKSNSECDLGESYHRYHKAFRKEYTLASEEFQKVCKVLETSMCVVDPKILRLSSGYRISLNPIEGSKIDYYEVSYDSFIEVLKKIDSVTEINLHEIVESVNKRDFVVPTGASL